MAELIKVKQEKTDQPTGDLLTQEFLQQIKDFALKGVASMGQNAGPQAAMNPLTPGVVQFPIYEEGELLDEAVVFFAPLTHYALASYIKDGKEVLPPYHNTETQEMTIKFKNNHRYMDTEKRMQIQCSFKTVFKSVCDYIRQSPHFGLLIFETMAGAKAVDMDHFKAVTSYMTMVAGLNDSDLIARCRHEEIEIETSDMQALKAQLVYKLAKTEISRYQQSLLDRKEESLGLVKQLDTDPRQAVPAYADEAAT